MFFHLYLHVNNCHVEWFHPFILTVVEVLTATFKATFITAFKAIVITFKLIKTFKTITTINVVIVVDCKIIIIKVVIIKNDSFMAFMDFILNNVNLRFMVVQMEIMKYIMAIMKMLVLQYKV